MECGTIAERHPTARSKITNGKRLLEETDGRSKRSRRFHDLVASFSKELGASPDAFQLALIKQAASLVIQSETMQSALVRGEPVDAEELTRVSNLVGRTLKGLLHKRQANKPQTPTLAQYLAQKAAEKAADALEDESAGEVADEETAAPEPPKVAEATS